MPALTAYENAIAYRDESARAPEALNLAGKRVVIVEDEGIAQMQLQRALKHAGLLVVGVARTGEEGVQVALREHPDIVLMDIKMPGEINGLEAARRILADHSLCVLMLTAYTEYQDEAQRIGASGYVLKPINSASLLAEVQAAWENWLQRSSDKDGR